MFKSMTQDRDAAQQWYLVDGERVLGLYDAADDHRTAVANQHRGGCLLRVQARVQLRTGYTAEVRHGVLQVQVQEDGVLRRDLRGYRKPQEGVDVLDCGRTSQLRCGNHRHARTLTDQRRNVVLRHDVRTGKDLKETAALRRSQDEIQAEVVCKIGERKPTGWSK